LRTVVRATLPRLVAVLALASAAVVVAAPTLVRLIAPGISDPALAVRCMRVTAVTVLAFGVAGYLGAALRSTHAFGWAASIYAAYNVGIVSALVLLHERVGVLGAAIGIAVGAVLMIAIQFPAFLRRLRTQPRSTVVSLEAVALGAFVPIAVYTLIRQGQVWIERFLASDLAAGTISHLNYAQKVAQVPMVLSIMVVTVTIPMLARSAVTGDEAAARRRTDWDLRAVSAVVLVASAYLIAFAPTLVGWLFEHGRFTAADTAATAGIMRVYTLGLLGQALVVTMTRSYYSAGRPTWFPVAAMTAGLAATALVAASLVPFWGAAAIAAGNAVGITTTAVLLLRGQRIAWRPVGVPVVRLAVAAASATAVGLASRSWLAVLPRPATAVLGGIAVLATFAAGLLVLGGEEGRWLRSRISVDRGGSRVR
jgi:putative peptidoglycan lipid II flippase